MLRTKRKKFKSVVDINSTIVLKEQNQQDVSKKVYSKIDMGSRDESISDRLYAMNQEVYTHNAKAQHPSFHDRKITICMDCKDMLLGNKCTPCHGIGCDNSVTVENGIMFIGEAPGFTENRDKVPFVGRSGILLRRYIDSISITEYSYLTNVVHCRPDDNKTPTLRHVQTCKRYVLGEIKVNKPKIIVLLGSVAASTFLKTYRSMAKIVNKPFVIGDTVFMVMYHPSYVMRTNNLKSYTDGFNILAKLWTKMCSTYVCNKSVVDDFNVFLSNSQKQKQITMIVREERELLNEKWEEYYSLTTEKGIEPISREEFDRKICAIREKELGIENLYETIQDRIEKEMRIKDLRYWRSRGIKLPRKVRKDKGIPRSKEYVGNKRGRKPKQVKLFKGK
jgi:DNA polymerase